MALPVFIWSLESYMKLVQRTSTDSESSTRGTVVNESFNNSESFSNKILSNLTIRDLKNILSGTIFNRVFIEVNSFDEKVLVKDLTKQSNFCLVFTQMVESFNYTLLDREFYIRVSGFFSGINTFFLNPGLPLISAYVSSDYTHLVGFHKFRNSVHPSLMYIQRSLLSSIPQDAQCMFVLFCKTVEPRFYVVHNGNEALAGNTHPEPNDVGIDLDNITLHDSFFAFLTLEFKSTESSFEELKLKSNNKNTKRNTVEDQSAAADNPLKREFSSLASRNSKYTFSTSLRGYITCRYPVLFWRLIDTVIPLK
jgi:hypothetical protein